uniref:Transmembrane protein 71 isoform X2 n=1 Tax=Geotrypetes seraphini TaxID=260995 RepID=A0A6P8Q748_GEOSA|nr:transmembrane protein 71 isoform X2 [Geotrypetes seraphini]
MYQLLQFTSTPLRKKCSSLLKRETGRNTSSPECSYSSDRCGSPGGTTVKHSCMGLPLAYRHSPRLLTNGYYVLNENSSLHDDQGNITLNPCHSISYRENLVRIFRKKRRLRHTLANLLSHPWLQSEVLGTTKSSPQTDEDNYAEADYDNDDQIELPPKPETPVPKENPDPILSRRKLHCSSPESFIMLQKYPCRQRNQIDFISEIQPPVSAMQLMKTIRCSSPDSYVRAQNSFNDKFSEDQNDFISEIQLPVSTIQSMKKVRCSSPDSYVRAQNSFSRAREINIFTKLLNQMIVLLVCLILSICARCVMGGLFISWMAFILVIALTCAIKPSLSSFFKSFKLRSM